MSPSSPSLRRYILHSFLPLSFSQKRLWFLDQFEPGNSNYNIPSSIILGNKNNINIEAIEYSFIEIIKRHESLRTTFSFDIKGESRLIIQKECNSFFVSFINIHRLTLLSSLLLIM